MTAIATRLKTSSLTLSLSYHMHNTALSCVKHPESTHSTDYGRVVSSTQLLLILIFWLSDGRYLPQIGTRYKMYLGQWSNHFQYCRYCPKEFGKEVILWCGKDCWTHFIRKFRYFRGSIHTPLPIIIYQYIMMIRVVYCLGI